MDRHLPPETNLCADGSINVEHYIRIAHQMRSEQVHRLAAQVASNADMVPGLIDRLRSLFARRPRHHSQQSA